MNTFCDYESLGFLDFRLPRPDLLEAFAGTAVVGWQGKIERQLVNLLDDAEKGRNFTYADKLREFLRIWRDNEITGSINRETIEILKSAADILSVDQWNLAAYFGSLKDQLKILIASEEQLPRGMDFGNEPLAGTQGGGHSAPPMSPDFGAEKTPPGGPEAPGGAGTELGTPGAPGPAPGPETPIPGAEGEESAAPSGEEEEEIPGRRLGLA